jgi:hypothetical protein
LRFFDDAFPLIVTFSAPVFDAEEVRSMATGFERYFGRGERYAVVSISPRTAPAPGPRERKLISDWVNEPRVRDFTKRLCVASATVVNGALARAALNVLIAVWKPPLPQELVPDAERGIDYCLARIRDERLPIGQSLDLMRSSALAQLRGVL